MPSLFRNQGKPRLNATKNWLTDSGGCILANNSSKIPTKKLNRLFHVWVVIQKE